MPFLTVGFKLHKVFWWDCYWIIARVEGGVIGIFLLFATVPSGPKKAPHWAQKKCSGCQVLSKAVTTFCETEETQTVSHATPAPQ